MALQYRSGLDEPVPRSGIEILAGVFFAFLGLLPFAAGLTLIALSLAWLGVPMLARLRGTSTPSYAEAVWLAISTIPCFFAASVMFQLSRRLFTAKKPNRACESPHCENCHEPAVIHVSEAGPDGEWAQRHYCERHAPPAAAPRCRTNIVQAVDAETGKPLPIEIHGSNMGDLLEVWQAIRREPGVVEITWNLGGPCIVTSDGYERKAVYLTVASPAVIIVPLSRSGPSPTPHRH